MTYNPDICNPEDTVSTVISEMNANFNAMDTVYDINHVQYSDETTNRAKHKYSQFVNLTDKGLTAPSLNTSELAFYVKDVSGAPQLFYKEPSAEADDGSLIEGAERQFSGSIVTGGATATAGEAPLPGGLSVKWGYFTKKGSGSFNKTFAGDFGLSNYTTACFVVIGSALDANISFMTFTDFLTTGFTYRDASNLGTQKIQWMAIGL